MKNYFVSILLVVVGGAVVLLPVSIANVCTGKSFIPFGHNIPYILRLGIESNAGSMDPAEKILPKEERADKDESLKSDIVSKAISSYSFNLFMIFRAFEVTNNLNYYFIKKVFPPLRFLLGPVILVPFALCGIILLIVKRRIFKKEGLLFLYLLAYMVPICMFKPLSRYRLILIPMFCIYAQFALIYLKNSLIKVSEKKYRDFSVFMLLLMGAFFFATPRGIPELASDYTTYGMALKFKGADNREILDCYKKAYEIDPFSYKTIRFYTNYLIKTRKYEKAESILEPLYRLSPGKQFVYRNYALSLYYGKRMKKLIQVLKSEEGIWKMNRFDYFMMLGNAYKELGNYKKAENVYKSALKNADNYLQERTIYDLMNKLRHLKKAD